MQRGRGGVVTRIDLGGVHGAQSSSVNLDSLGLTVGDMYDFDRFFAERHTTQSNFRIDTSIALKQPSTGVPEPSSITLLGLALAGLGFARRKRHWVARERLRKSPLRAGFFFGCSHVCVLRRLWNTTPAPAQPPLLGEEGKTIPVT